MNSFTLTFNQIEIKEASTHVKKHQGASKAEIAKAFPNAKLADVFDTDEKFFSTAFLIEDVGGHSSQDHLQGMVRMPGTQIEVSVVGETPSTNKYDSYRFYAGIDKKNKAICILAFAKRVAKSDGTSDKYVDVENFYYAYHYEINDPDMHSGKHNFNHLSCNPHCDGTSL